MLPSPAHSCLSHARIWCLLQYDLPGLSHWVLCRLRPWGSSEQQKSRRISCWEDAGYKRNVYPGWGLSCEQLRISLNTEEVMFPSWKCHCCRLELFLSWISYIHLKVQWEGVKSLPCSSPHLLAADQSFKGCSCRKLMFESFLRPWYQSWKLLCVLSPLCCAHPAPQISARSAWCHLMTTHLCREHPKYADLGVFLYAFFKLRCWPTEC